MRGGRGKLIQLVYRGSRRCAEAAWLLLRTLSELSGFSLPQRLQVKRPFSGLRFRSNLDLLVRGLEPEHLDFHRIISRRKIGQFVRTGLIGSGHGAVITLSGDDGGSRQRLARELNGPVICEARLGEQRHTKRRT